MKTFARALSILVLAAAVAAAGCATTRPSGPARIGATNGGAFEAKTVYQCTASTGGQVGFSKPKWFSSVLIRGGFAWIKPHSALDTIGTPPSNPIPSANTLVDGWQRLGDGQYAAFGIEALSSSTESGTAVDAVSFYDWWCETQNTDMVFGAH